MFAGNTDRFSIVSHELKNPIITKFLRINPITWNSYISLRAEFYGCREGKDEETIIFIHAFQLSRRLEYLLEFIIETLMSWPGGEFNVDVKLSSCVKNFKRSLFKSVL